MTIENTTLDLANTVLPRHVAIIPDGNRRWAKSQGMPVIEGHRRGSKTIKEVTRHALNIGIPEISLWGSSVNNVTKRSALEVRGLFEVYRLAAEDLLTTFARGEFTDVQIIVSGRWRELFSNRAREAMEKLEDETRGRGPRRIQLLMAYDGREEMLQAVRKLAANQSEEITAERLKANLWSAPMSPVDLLVRTGCDDDPHWSDGFMMWDCADTQLYFTETPWPDFIIPRFEEALSSYSRRERRLGR